MIFWLMHPYKWKENGSLNAAACVAVNPQHRVCKFSLLELFVLNSDSCVQVFGPALLCIYLQASESNHYSVGTLN